MTVLATTFSEWLAEEEKRGEVVRIKSPIKCGDPDSIVDAVPLDVREENIRIGNIPGANGKIMETELRALGRYLHTLPNKPIGLIEAPVNNTPSIPLVINPWATRERSLRMLGCKDKDELARKYREMKTNLIKPVVVEKRDAPVKEVIITENDIDLYQQVPRCWVEFENMPWSPTGGAVWIIFDPETRTHDLSEIRVGFFEWENGDPNTPCSEDRRKRHAYLTITWRKESNVSDSGRFYAEYRRLNKPLPMAFAMCPEPAIYGTANVRATMVWPEDGVDEYAVAGGFKGAPVEVVESETIPGLMVPAQAEWVFEGELLPEDWIVPAYGEGVLPGYFIGSHVCPIFRIKCITHRKNPLWCVTWSNNGLDHEGAHTGFIEVECEAEAINHLRQSGYNVKDVVSYDMTTVVVQADVDGLQKGPHYGKALLNCLYSCPNTYVGNRAKFFIVVGPDINPYDLRDVLWALNTRVQLISDSIFIEKGCAAWGDVSGRLAEHGWPAYGEQVLIDGLIKVPERGYEYPPRTDPVSWEREAIEQMKRKLGGQE